MPSPLPGHHPVDVPSNPGGIGVERPRSTRALGDKPRARAASLKACAAHCYGAATMSSLRVNGVELSYADEGVGPPVLLIHAGIADRRMWDDVVPLLRDRFRLIRPDLRGYRETPLPDGPFVYAADLLALLDRLEVERVHLVEVSMGGQVALDLAIAHPERVERLVAVAPGLNGWRDSPELAAAAQEERAALEAGDLDEASWVNVRTWLDGPLRSPEGVDPELRRRVFAMQRRSFELENEAAEGGWLVRDRRAHLGKLRMPVLVMVGELDVGDMLGIAELLNRAIDGARLVRLPAVAHLPPMEAPEGFAETVGAFLSAPPSGE